MTDFSYMTEISVCVFGVILGMILGLDIMRPQFVMELIHLNVLNNFDFSFQMQEAKQNWWFRNETIGEEFPKTSKTSQGILQLECQLGRGVQPSQEYHEEYVKLEN